MDETNEIDYLQQIREEYGITLDTTDDRLQEIAGIVESEAKNDDVVLNGDILDYLQQVRDELSEEQSA